MIESITKAQDIINKYDDLISTWVKNLSDEQIDELIGTEEWLLNVIESMILTRKIHTERRLIASKEEEKIDTIITRSMNRLWLDNFECVDWKIKKTVQWRFEVDIEKVPREFLQQNRWKIHSAIVKNEKLEGVNVLEWHNKYSVR